MTKVKFRCYITAILIFSITLLSFKNDAPPTLKEFKIYGVAQGTTYHITYYAADSLVVKKQVDSILDKIDSSLSIYKTYSLISQFNNSADGVEMDNYLKTIIYKSIDIFKQTDGISDITVYPLMSSWGFGPQPVLKQPDSSDILVIMPCIGTDKIRVVGKHLIKDKPCIKIDLNGIAQGYSVDIVAAFLEENNIQNYMVEIGGEIRIKGKKNSNDTLWQIGIETPAQYNFDEPVIKKIIQLKKGAVTTSGNYRKYHAIKGKRISHLINPKTGYPFQNELISVTVFAKDAITADGYDNALMGMGLKKAWLFLNKHQEMDAYFIYRNANGVVSDTSTAGFYKLIKE